MLGCEEVRLVQEDFGHKGRTKVVPKACGLTAERYMTPGLVHQPTQGGGRVESQSAVYVTGCDKGW